MLATALLYVRPPWIKETTTCSFAPVHSEHSQVLPRVVLKDLVLHGQIPIPFSGSKALHENNDVVEDTASPVQVELGLDLLGHLRHVDVVLEPTPIVVGELVAPCVLALDLLLRDHLVHLDEGLGAGEKDGEENDVQVQVVHPPF